MSIDRGRYRNRSHELRGCSQLLQQLSKVPDRATEKDFRQVIDLLTGAADDIDELLRAELTGCSCRRIQEDGYHDYLVYDENCRHHRGLYLLEKDLERRREKAERVYKNELRLRFITAALKLLKRSREASHEND
jgi:hypothetical protein